MAVLAPFFVGASPARSAEPTGSAKTTDRDAAYRASLSLYQYDKHMPLDVQVIPGRHYTDSQELTITYASTNGQRVPAVIFEPNRASMWHPAPVIILLHGLGGSKESLVPLGHFLAATGYAAFIIDEYGQGQRQLPQQADETAMQEEAEAVRGVQQTIVDVRRGIDYLHTRIHISPKRICVMGFSLGAIIAADVAGVDPRVKSVILISGGGDLGLILRNLAETDPYFKSSRYGQISPEQIQMLGHLLAAEDPLTFAGHIAPRPVLMQNGKLDRIIPQAAADSLYEALKAAPDNHAEIDWYPDSNHFVGLDLMYPKIRVWLEKYL